MTKAANASQGYCDRIGAARLVRMAYAGQDLIPLREKLRAESAEPGAAMDLAVIEQVMGNRALGLSIQHEALMLQQCYRPARPAIEPRLRVLALAAPLDLGGNTPIDFLINDPEVELKILYVLPDRPFADRLPEHDVAIVIIPDEEEAAPSLAAVAALIATWPKPILNRPDRIRQLDRDRLFGVIGSIPNLYIPPTIKLPRHELAAIGVGAALPAEVSFPMILRPIGSHAGRGLERLAGPAEIEPYLSANPGADFFLSRFIDYSSPDGLYRKYRIVFVDRKPFAVHMAMTENWAVWYLNADMYASAEKRDEEARFMTGFDEGFGARHKAALDEIAARLDLDYLIIDCAETKDGKLLVFEAGATMIVHDMDSVDLFPYKAPQMHKIFTAFTAMLDKYAGGARSIA